MEASDSTSFIFLLHEELLWRIFVENTYIGPLYPFTSIRHSPPTSAVHCSQVCRQWRATYLSCSSI
ncbi:hypothetical protein CPC08DRAFT_131158 [Agrocybe pediades]|nr:hypothetical protein CPC08DRAFT_131158 [Agrocybe pediades]